MLMFLLLTLNMQLPVGKIVNIPDKNAQIYLQLHKKDSYYDLEEQIVRTISIRSFTLPQPYADKDIPHRAIIIKLLNEQGS